MSETFTPPASVASAAKRALGWIADGKAGDGFTSAGRTRAGQLSRREGISRDTIMRMVSFFARHEVDKKAEGFNQGEKGFPSPGRVAWDAWGGDAGKSWAESVASKLNKEKANMAQDFATSYAEIIKYDKNDDGTITVYGKATSDDLDIDQQICDNDWLSKAMPEWFKSGGNIREQHSSIAAGVATELDTKSDGFYVTAHVVDPTSVKKVEAKVLKGFSIGIKGPRVVRDEKAANGRIIDGQIVEVSLVDRPANPTCQLVLAKSVGGESTLTQVEDLIEKREFSQSEREDAASAGQAMPDGSYPIKTVADLKNAIQAFGRAKDPAATKKHIIRRARALGAVDQLPEDWNVKKSPVIDTIIEMHEKAVNGDKVKFDQAAYDTARKALANLIIVEAGEMAEGSDERDDIETLIAALKHLFNWYEGEVEEGEAISTDADMLQLSASKDASEDCDCDGCAACAKDGGCDKSPCVKCMAAKSVSKCLECGCGLVGQDHGLATVQIAGNNGGISTTANVSTAASLNTDGNIKSAEGEEAPATDAPTETVVEEVKEEAHAIEAEVEHLVAEAKEELKDILDEKAVSAIVEKAVKSATESVKAEIAELHAATKAAEEKAVALESELVAAKSAVVVGGPKRTGRAPLVDNNELLSKAAEYRLKAQATTDPILVKGYKALEKEFLAKAGQATDEE